MNEQPTAKRTTKPCPEEVLENFGLATQRQWRARKRAEMDDAIKALSVFMRGAHFTPWREGVYIGKIIDDCRTLRIAMQEKNWK